MPDAKPSAQGITTAVFAMAATANAYAAGSVDNVLLLVAAGVFLAGTFYYLTGLVRLASPA